MEIKLYENEKIGEKMYHAKSKGGLNVYFIPKKGYSKQYATMTTKYGSIDNEFVPIGETEVLKVPEGIAHFLEHKLFEEPDFNIFDKFSELGANVNAFTGFTQTSYLFSSTENFDESLETLIKFVQNPHFTDENVEKEKGIIAQEIKMYDDDAGWRVFFNCLDAMYYNNPVKIDIAGTVDTIMEIDKDLLYKSYNTFYHPENMVLFIVGDLDFDKIMELVEKSERTDYKELGNIERKSPNEPKEVRQKLVTQDMVTSNPIFYIGFKDDKLGLDGMEESKKEMVSNILIDMLFSSSSEFYNEMYDKGLINNSFGGYFSGKETYGHSLIGGESDKPHEVYETIMAHLRKPAGEVLKKENFNRIMNDEVGNFLMSLDSIESIGNSATESILENFNMLEHLELMKNIEFQDIIDRFNEHLVEEKSVLSIIMPAE